MKLRLASIVGAAVLLSATALSAAELPPTPEMSTAAAANNQLQQEVQELSKSVQDYRLLTSYLQQTARSFQEQASGAQKAAAALQDQLKQKTDALAAHDKTILDLKAKKEQPCPVVAAPPGAMQSHAPTPGLGTGFGLMSKPAVSAAPAPASAPAKAPK